VIPLLLSPFFAHQRAVLLMLGTAVVVVVGVCMGATARRRMRVHVGHVLVTALAVVGVCLAVSIIPAANSQGALHAPFAGTVSRTLGSTLGSVGKAESAQDRLNKWAVAWDTAREHVIVGWGFGKEYSYFAVGIDRYVTTGIAENIELDLVLTAGLIGLVLFFVSIGVSVVEGFKAWRLHPDRRVGVAALGLMAVVVGFMAKAQVESIFENYRLATELGLFLGMLRSAVTSGGGDLRALRTEQEFLQYEVV
jgi:O-antigen ligase